MSKKGSKKNNNNKGGKSNKVWGTKQVLSSPFAAQMPASIPGSLDGVILALKRLYPKPPLAKILPPGNNNNNRRKKPEGLVIGLNQVTKCLERDVLRMVVVARDVMPVLVSHIPVLCYLKDTKLVVVANGGVEMALLFGTNRALAFGIMKEVHFNSDFGPHTKHNMQSLTQELDSFTVHLDYPWLLPQSKRREKEGGSIPKLQDMYMKPHVSIRKERNNSNQKVIMKNEAVKPKLAGQKRKRDHSIV